MTEAEWLTCTDPDRMLAFLKEKGILSERKARLFAVACCRRIGHLLMDGRSRDAVNTAELYADEAISHDAFFRIFEGANKPRSLISDLHWPEGWRVAEFVSFEAALLLAEQSTNEEVYQTERENQSALLREILGNPFRTIRLHPSKMKANHGRVRQLAWTIYNELGFARLPMLADALEEAGCTNADILSHCRQPGEHLRGCWVVDLLLGKE